MLTILTLLFCSLSYSYDEAMCIEERGGGFQGGDPDGLFFNVSHCDNNTSRLTVTNRNTKQSFSCSFDGGDEIVMEKGEDEWQRLDTRPGKLSRYSFRTLMSCKKIKTVKDVADYWSKRAKEEREAKNNK